MAPTRQRHQETSERISASADGSPSHRLIHLLHLASYDFAVPFAAGRSVLDLGCGTGYGAARLAPHCRTVTGADVSHEAVTEASERFAHPNLEFTQIAPTEETPLPFADSAFDVVLSFQVIEHVRDPLGYLREARRVLKEGGALILATPDRATRLYRGQRPWNRFHLHEYTPEELHSLVGKVFDSVDLFGVGGPRDLLAPELRRTARLRLATLPFTFRGCPEPWRRTGLEQLTRARTALRRGRENRRRARVGRSQVIGSAPERVSSEGERPSPPLRALFSRQRLRGSRPSAPDEELAEMPGAGRGPASGSGMDPAAAGVVIGPGVTPSVCIVAVAR